jgi:hypothetical protein
MIREGLLDSERYAQLSDQGKLFFHHILLLADDFGCLSLSPAYLRRRCFYDGPSNERIAKLICELADADMLRPYEVDRRALAFIPKFGQRMRIDKLKYPPPPPVFYADDSEALNKFNKLTSKMPDKCLTNDGQMPVKCPPEVEVKLNRKEVEVKRSEETITALPGSRSLYEWATTNGIKAFDKETATSFKARIEAEYLKAKC